MSMEVDKYSEDAPAIKSVEGWVIMVTNLHEEVSEEDVSEYFSEFGEVHNIHLNLDRRTGYVKGYALIEYRTADEAEAAVSAANGSEFLDRKLEVDFAFVSPPERPNDKAYAPASSTNKMASQRDRSRSPVRE